MIQQLEEPKDLSTSVRNGRETASKVKAVCRFRPFNEAEKAKPKVFTIAFDVIDNAIYRRKDQAANIFAASQRLTKTGSSNESLPAYTSQPFIFDSILSEQATQQDAYQVCARAQVDRVLLSSVPNYCFSIMTYGQTSSGKTFTLFGDYKNQMSLRAGILPRMVHQLFQEIDHHKEMRIKIKVSGLEIYCGYMYDLWIPFKNRPSLSEKEGTLTGIGRPTQCEVFSADQLLQICSTMIANRCVSATESNSQSSRSHALFLFTINKVVNNVEVTTMMYLADLAGSQKVGGDQRAQKQGNFINSSLSALQNCIKQMAANQQASFRTNILTRALRLCFEGNCRTTIMVNVSLHDKDGESAKSMRFGQCARLVKPRPAPQKSMRVQNDEQDLTEQIYDEVLNLAKIQIFRLISSLEDCRIKLSQEQSARFRAEYTLEEEKSRGTNLEKENHRLREKCKQLELENMKLKRGINEDDDFYS